MRPYLEDYQRLVEMYRLLRSAYEPHVLVDKSFLRKTAEIVQKHSLTDAVLKPTSTYELGPQALLALLGRDQPPTVKVFNLLKELHRLVGEGGHAAPYLLSIGERAEAIRRRFEEQQIDSEQAVRELNELVRQLAEAHTERQSSPLSQQAFAVEWWLRTHQVDPKEAFRAAQAMETAFSSLPYWMDSQEQERELRKELYKALRKIGVNDVVSWADAILNLLRRAAQ